MSGMKAKRRLSGRRQPRANVSLAASQWDMGATGPANRINATIEPATDIDPETGKETPNPNGVARVRKLAWVQVYFDAGHLTAGQFNAALDFRAAAGGNKNADPLAALRIDRTPCGDKQASDYDARAKYRALKALIPKASIQVVERVVLDNEAVWSRHGQAARLRHLKRLADGLEAMRK